MTATDTSSSETIVITSKMVPRGGGQAELIEFLSTLATSLHDEPGCLHYSMHRRPGDTSGALTIIQAYSSPDAFREHAEWMRPHVPELSALLEDGLTAPVLLEQVGRSGHAKETFLV